MFGVGRGCPGERNFTRKVSGERANAGGCLALKVFRQLGHLVAESSSRKILGRSCWWPALKPDPCHIKAWRRLQQWTAALVLQSPGSRVCCADGLRAHPQRTARLRSPGILA